MLQKKQSTTFIAVMAVASAVLLIVIAVTVRPGTDVRPERPGNGEEAEEPKPVDPYVLDEVSPDGTTDAPAQEAPDDVSPVSAAFGEDVRFEARQGLVYEMGPLAVRLQRIDDSRCPPDVQCVWAGELSAVFVVWEPAFPEKTQEVALSLRSPVQEISLDLSTGMSVPYRFELKDVTENATTLVIDPLE